MELQPDNIAGYGLRRYVQLVAEELASSTDEPTIEFDPVNAHLALNQRLPQFPTRDATLRWNEHHGWSLTVEPHDTHDPAVQIYLGIDILPTPRAVAHFAARLLRGEEAGQPEPLNMHALGADDDLPQRLAAYTQPTTKTMPASPDLLTINVENNGTHIILHVHGELDILTAPQLRESISHALNQNPDLLILDLTGLRFLSSAGIHALVDTQHNAQHPAHHNHPQIRVVANGYAVLRPLEVLGLTTSTAIYPTLHAALTDLGTVPSR